jgi:hypothetical protein
MLYTFPVKAAFGKMIPKNKIYEHADVNTSTKEKFVAQIDKITWQYKLAPETINLPATDAVAEIQVFDIKLKDQDIDEALLRVIDKAIPFPIIFQIYQNDKVKIKAAYKRPSEADKTKWVVESYFESEWMDANLPKKQLPVALDMGILYGLIIQSLIPDKFNVNILESSIKEHVDRIETIKAKEREYEKLKSKRDKEKQFNRKAEWNAQLKIIQKELDELRRFEAC